MATRRSRLQIKPNIGPRATSIPKQDNSNGRTPSVQISAELAAGAATAISFKKGENEPKTFTKGQQLVPQSKGDAKEKSSQTENHDMRDADELDSTKTVQRKDLKPASFTRLKRFGLNLGSQSIPRIDVSAIASSQEAPASSKSPKSNTDNLLINRSPSKSPLKSASPDKTVLSDNNNKSLHSGNGVTKKDANLTSGNHIRRSLTRPKPNLPVRSIVSRPDVGETNIKGKSPQQSTMKPKPSTSSINELVSDQEEQGLTNNEMESPKVAKPPSVIQRLPFRSRFPKAKPNIDAIRFKGRNLTIPGNKDDHTSGPSSPLKSPRTGRFFSPLKFAQSVHKSISPEEVAKKPEQDRETLDVPVDHADRRKRHFSNSSISSVISDIQASNRNSRNKSPKTYPVDEPLDRSSMTMGDLVHWNPLKNPMQAPATTPKKKVKLDKEKENIEEPNEEPPEENPTVTEDSKDMPAPQVKIGPDGSIILNEESLVIQKQDESVVPEIVEENENTATYNSFRKPFNKTSWSEWETEKFYRALSYLGTDFSLMIKLFPKRSRGDIKTKFKREDKLNKNKVDMALKNKIPFSMSFFKQEEELDKQEAERKKKELEEKMKKSKQAKADKLKEKKKSKEKGEKELQMMRENYRSHRNKERKSYHEEEESDGDVSDVSVETPVKKHLRLPFTRRDSLPFVPPFCLPQHEESNEDTMETLVSMSDSEILSPQKTPRTEVITQVTENSIDMNDTPFPPNANVQIAQLTDSNNSPLVLVYHTPEDGKGDTVIHVYQLQNHQLGSSANIQIPLNDGNSIIEIPNQHQLSRGNITSNESGEFIVGGHSGIEDDTEEEGTLPFVIGSGDDNSSQVVVSESNELSQSQTEGQGFINIIDINASKISTPNKQSNSQCSKNTNSENGHVSKEGNSFFQVRISPTNDSDEESSSTQPVAIDNEFVASDIDNKFDVTNNFPKLARGKKKK